jgi:hypothetical protein
VECSRLPDSKGAIAVTAVSVTGKEPSAVLLRPRRLPRSRGANGRGAQPEGRPGEPAHRAQEAVEKARRGELVTDGQIAIGVSRPRPAAVARRPPDRWSRNAPRRPRPRRALLPRRPRAHPAGARVSSASPDAKFDPTS